ncbi:signal-regulatory protein beta-1-like isoform X2 [Harpia harpyja]|nr:signal-regulatory protein beta-1-like isoform X2 [Harpia harpyja]XP_052640000.1 signal-regulatory protein beta-1-like isoform X2 [Harpia harpyja]
MEPLPHGPGRAAWPLTCLVLLSLYGWPGVGAQGGPDFELQQPQDKVSVAAGEMLNLTCTMSGTGPPGPVKWLKGWDDGNETVYEQAGSFPRVTRVVSESNTDFSIRIRDVRPEDAGTYYCVKFDKRLGGLDVFRRGKGTVVSVHAKPTPPFVSGPNNRTGLGQRVPFTCTAGGFFPKEVEVKWFKGKDRISVQPPNITLGQTKSSYNMSSTAVVTLQEDDVRSQLICEVRHSTLTTPLRGMYKLSKALRVSPSVSVVADVPSPVEVNKTMNFTCHVKGFYPRDVAVAWLENGMEIKVENISQPVETPRGLFELRSVVEVQATEEKNGSVFTCRVVHDAQDPISGTATLWIAAPARGGSSDRTQADNDNLLLIYIVVGVVCTVLALLVAAILYLIRAKQSKGKDTKRMTGKQLLLTPFSLSLEHQCLDAEFTAVLLQLLPKGGDGAELPRLFAGCRESSAWLLLHANACQEQCQTRFCCSLYVKCLTAPPPPAPPALCQEQSCGKGNETPENCRHLPLGKDMYLLLQQSLHGGSCAWGSGVGVVLFPELFLS